MSGLRKQLVERIREKVLTGEIGVGRENATSETKLAESFDVSRVPVREALTVLADRQLVEQFPQRGVAARRISAGEALEAIRYCSAIEMSVVHYLTEEERLGESKRVADDIQTFRSDVEGLESAVEEGPDYVLLRETALHRNVAQSAGFLTGGRSIEEFRDCVHLYQRTSAPLPEENLRDIPRANMRWFDAVSKLNREECEASLSELFDQRMAQLDRL